MANNVKMLLLGSMFLGGVANATMEDFVDKEWYKNPAGASGIGTIGSSSSPSHEERWHSPRTGSSATLTTSASPCSDVALCWFESDDDRMFQDACAAIQEFDYACAAAIKALNSACAGTKTLDLQKFKLVFTKDNVTKLTSGRCGILLTSLGEMEKKLQRGYTKAIKAASRNASWNRIAQNRGINVNKAQDDADYVFTILHTAIGNLHQEFRSKRSSGE
jgi:hypothetical protein